MRHGIPSQIPGGMFFFTVNLADRSQRQLTERVDELRAVFRRVREPHPFRPEAVVILPEHPHAIRTLAGNDSDSPRDGR
jgi:putative transposase